MNDTLKVAIQGYEGSFHHIVARRCLGEHIEIVPCATFREVARQVECGDSDYGVMAVENSIAGSILPNLGILHNSRLCFSPAHTEEDIQYLLSAVDEALAVMDQEA